MVPSPLEILQSQDPSCRCAIEVSWVLSKLSCDCWGVTLGSVSSSELGVQAGSSSSAGELSYKPRKSFLFGFCFRWNWMPDEPAIMPNMETLFPGATFWAPILVTELSVDKILLFFFLHRDGYVEFCLKYATALSLAYKVLLQWPVRKPLGAHRLCKSSCNPYNAELFVKK